MPLAKSSCTQGRKTDRAVKGSGQGNGAEQHLRGKRKQRSEGRHSVVGLVRGTHSAERYHISSMDNPFWAPKDLPAVPEPDAASSLWPL